MIVLRLTNTLIDEYDKQLLKLRGGSLYYVTIVTDSPFVQPTLFIDGSAVNLNPLYNYVIGRYLSVFRWQPRVVKYSDSERVYTVTFEPPEPVDFSDVEVRAYVPSAIDTPVGDVSVPVRSARLLLLEAAYEPAPGAAGAAGSAAAAARAGRCLC